MMRVGVMHETRVFGEFYSNRTLWVWRSMLSLVKLLRKGWKFDLEINALYAFTPTGERIALSISPDDILELPHTLREGDEAKPVPVQMVQHSSTQDAAYEWLHRLFNHANPDKVQDTLKATKGFSAPKTPLKGTHCTACALGNARSRGLKQSHICLPSPHGAQEPKDQTTEQEVLDHEQVSLIYMQKTEQPSQIEESQPAPEPAQGDVSAVVKLDNLVMMEPDDIALAFQELGFVQDSTHMFLRQPVSGIRMHPNTEAAPGSVILTGNLDEVQRLIPVLSSRFTTRIVHYNL